MEHHPVFADVPRWRGTVAPGWTIDFLGVKTDQRFERGMPYHVDRTEPCYEEPALPGFDEEYFEWIDVLESVKAAADQFTMIELGAGYGRWVARAAAALRQITPLPFKLVAVEPEPTHFRWLREHLRSNGVNPAAHELIEAAVTAEGRRVPFYVGNPSGWYGQAVAEAPSRGFFRRMGRFVRSLGSRTSAEVSIAWVPSVALREILERHPRVDLIDLDLQGAEAEVLASAIDAIDRQVRRVHVGTHSKQIEKSLRDLFSVRGWILLNDYACLSLNQTPFGEIRFEDGVQTWLNPRL